jgi:hypothetical protein
MRDDPVQPGNDFGDVGAAVGASRFHRENVRAGGDAELGARRHAHGFAGVVEGDRVLRGDDAGHECAVSEGVLTAVQVAVGFQ